VFSAVHEVQVGFGQRPEQFTGVPALAEVVIHRVSGEAEAKG
jgi:hypothetical protein